MQKNQAQPPCSNWGMGLIFDFTIRLIFSSLVVIKGDDFFGLFQSAGLILVFAVNAYE
ncbi:MAG: hypothetical protein JXK94_08745 [Deltaproteobacteria bacterium]|nr:hypothetical protein [Deltaproteobacteria bacterium]